MSKVGNIFEFGLFYKYLLDNFGLRKCPSLPKVDKSAFCRQVGQIEKMGDYKVVQIEEEKKLEKGINYKLFVIKKEIGQLGRVFLQF